MLEGHHPEIRFISLLPLTYREGAQHPDEDAGRWCLKSRFPLTYREGAIQV